MSKRGKAIQGATGAFLKQYGRKAQRNCEPNDRSYDRNMEKKIKSIDPRELSELMHDDIGSGVPREIEDRWFAGEDIEGVNFSHNDSVLVTDGLYSGNGGAVVCLVRL